MVMHLAIVNSGLPWLYVIICAASAVVGIFGILAGTVGKLALMRMYKFIFWIFYVFLCIWQAVDFIVALTYRSKSLDTCNAANGSNQASGSGSSSVSVGDLQTTFLGMDMGNVYGLANCDQAVQAGVIGLAILLFLGAIFMFYFGTIVNAYTRRLREGRLGHRLRDDEWDSNISDLTSAYRADAKAAPRYPLKPLKKNKKSGLLNKFKFGK
ncbi:hypothetical protein DM01DRAFT_1334949 [Hesseltinella vesiculosa]|uniref:Uncharacterized protein n=1 Tax=Hesseltinella vesiculosa TaxID=101127 RepID=A0A1X2GJT3_9FUNG|nr:hypothetical protein DM01DRAFT_1334949 [Hesseltinella vesiculosa]